ERSNRPVLQPRRHARPRDRAGGEPGDGKHPGRRRVSRQRVPLPGTADNIRQEDTRPMTTTGEFAAERAQLGLRDRDELHEIASAMGVRGATRLRKADLIEAILDKATSGTSVPEPTGEKPKKRATRKKAADTEAAEPAAPAAEAAEPDRGRSTAAEPAPRTASEAAP